MTYHAFYTPYDDRDTEDIDESEDWRFLQTIHWNGKELSIDLATLPQADKDSIHNWIVGESEAYFAEQYAYEETCLNAEGRKGVEKQLKQFSNIYHAMRN